MISTSCLEKPSQKTTPAFPQLPPRRRRSPSLESENLREQTQHFFYSPVSLLPEFVLPYLRFTIRMMGMFLKARLAESQTLRAAAEAAKQKDAPYQRGQGWVRRFRRQAESVSAALAGLVWPVTGSDFVSKALGMLEQTGWIRAHRFLFEQLRAHLLGWPEFLAPAGMPVRIRTAVTSSGNPPQSTCMDSESPPA